MKKAYDKRKETNPQKIQKVGIRLLLKLLREKTFKRYPKLAELWGDPYRIIKSAVTPH